MNAEGRFTLNGLYEPLSINTEQEIVANWRDLEVEQVGFRFKVLDESQQMVFDSDEKNERTKFLSIQLPFTKVRKKYIAELAITTKDSKRKVFRESFSTGNGSLNKAKWITRLDNPIEKEQTFFKDKSNITLAKRIICNSGIKEALIDICGLGYYTLLVNGKKVGNAFLNSDVTNYDKTVYYDTYDIRSMLNPGVNHILVELANGWYNAAPINMLGKYNVRKRLSVGKPCLLCQLNLVNEFGETETINSDGSWISGYGNYLFNNIYIGEHVTDALFHNETSPQTVQVCGPAGKLTPNFIPKVERLKRISPQRVVEKQKSVFIDFGEIITGQLSCDILKDYIGRVTIFYAEAIRSDEALDFSSCISGTYGVTDKEQGITATDAVIQKDLIEKTKTETYEFNNQYAYHSFRYVEMEFTGAVRNMSEVIDNVYAYSTHTNLALISNFKSSVKELNELWDAALNTRLNNIHSYFEDCARERFGYGGDIVALIDAQVYSLDADPILKKVFIDFVNDQTPNGGIPQTAPYIGIMTNGTSDGAGSLGWQMVLPILASKITKFYYNPDFIRQNREPLIKHLKYLLSFDLEYIRHCCLGDWGSIEGSIREGKFETPDQEFCSACMYLIILREYSTLLTPYHIPDTLAYQLQETIEFVRKEIILRFYHKSGFFQSGSQSSYAFALKAELFHDDRKKLLEKNLLNQLEQDKGVFKAGIFGMSWLYRILSDLGEDMLVYQWLTRKETPGFLGMLSSGNKVLGEFFPGKDNKDSIQGSLNHAMFSSYTVWMMEKLSGIRLKEGDNGVEQLHINPFFGPDIHEMEGTMITISGTIQSNWRRLEAQKVVFTMTFPDSLDYKVELRDDYVLLKKEILARGSGYKQIVMMISE